MPHNARLMVAHTLAHDIHLSKSTMPGPSSSTSHPEHVHTLPECYDDQVAFLYSKIEELKQLFKQFIEDHNEMEVFRDLRLPLGRLAVSANVVQVTLAEFCKAVKCVLYNTLTSIQILRSFIGRDIKPQITETFEQHPETGTLKSPVLPVPPNYDHEELPDTFSKSIHKRIDDPSNIERISDGTKSFEYKIREKGYAKYPITIKWRPTAPLPNADAIPAGLRFEVNPSNHIVVSDSPPMVDPPRTPANGDVALWRNGVPSTLPPTTVMSSKGKKRARHETIEEDADNPPRTSRRARVSIKNSELDVQNNPKPDIPAPLRRSLRLKTGHKSKVVSAKEKAKGTEEGNGSVGVSRSRTRSRAAAKRG